jgi:hypothetical protein
MRGSIAYPSRDAACPREGLLGSQPMSTNLQDWWCHTIFLSAPFVERLNKGCDIFDSTTFCLHSRKKKVPWSLVHNLAGTPLVPVRLNGRCFKIDFGCWLFTGLDNL